ncbi:MAG: hypothetical protein F6J92_41400, partial [Symploca sp. SIO1A3]|nr:hypothetical protein [Symploca sp. SIO1A3]
MKAFVNLLDHPPQPREKLDEQGAVEAELLAQVFQFLRIDITALVAANNEQCNVPWDDIHDKKDE